MNLDRILELVAKQMGDGASGPELVELEQLLRQYPNHQHLVSILRSVQSKKLKQPAHNEDLVVREAWEKIQRELGGMDVPMEEPEEIPRPAVRKMFARPAVKWAAAAVVTGIVVLSAFVYYLKVSGPSKSEAIAAVAPVQVTVAHGKPEMKLLPDGTVVWMNAGTQLSYREEGSTIGVYLEGEAYFQVKHDPARAFVVHADHVQVKALGTAFNVSAYPGEDRIEATLIEGKVQVTMEEKPDQKIILVPNEKFTVIHKRAAAGDSAAAAGDAMGAASYEVRPVKVLPALNEAGEVAWMQDRLAFQNELFPELAKRMERRYNVHIVFGDESLKKETLSGIFKNEDIRKALRVLQMTTPFQYHMKGDSVFLNQP